MGSSVGDGDDWEELSEEGNVDVDGEGDRDRRTANWVSKSDSVSILTVPSKREEMGVSPSDGGQHWGRGQGQEDSIMEDFEKKLDQIAKEYKKSLESNDYNNGLTLELEKSRATIQELNQLLAESVAKERETSEELKRKMAEISELSTQKRQETLEKGLLRELLREKDQLLTTTEQDYGKAKDKFEKEIADLKKRLKDKDDYNNKLRLELQKSRATIQEFDRMVTESIAKEKETSEELKRKMAEVAKRHTLLEEAFKKQKGELNKEITDLKKKLKGKDAYNQQLTLALEKRNAKIRELNRQVAESVAKEKKTSEELKNKMAEIRELSTQKRQETFEKEQLSALLHETEGRLGTIAEHISESVREQLEVFISKERRNLAEKLATCTGAKLGEESRETRGKLIVVGAEKGHSHSQSQPKQIREPPQNGERLLELEFLCEKDQPRTTAPENTVPLHRFWNGSVFDRDYIYTTDAREQFYPGGKAGWVYEGVVGHVFPHYVRGTVPLFRFWNKERKDHLFSKELKCGREGYVYERVCCYVFPTMWNGRDPSSDTTVLKKSTISYD